jgi:hypothetical protein
MPGSAIPLGDLPRPLELLARTLLVAALVLGLSHVAARPVVTGLIPVYRAAISALDGSFDLTDIAIAHEGPSEVVRFRANLSRPLDVKGTTLYPSGWHGVVPEGGIEVHYTLDGALQYPALALILVLAWPARPKELFARLAVFVPIALMLLLIDVPSTVIAELWTGLEGMVDPDALPRWMIWSRFLMGGGGLLLGIVAAALDMAVAARLVRPARSATAFLPRGASIPDGAASSR